MGDVKSAEGEKKYRILDLEESSCTALTRSHGWHPCMEFIIPEQCDRMVTSQGERSLLISYMQFGPAVDSPLVLTPLLALTSY